MTNLFSALSTNLGTIATPFGPQGSGQFSEWLVLTGVDQTLRAPCDTQVWVVEDPSDIKYLLLQIRWPRALRKNPPLANLLSEFPTYYILRYDDLDYVGVEHSLYPDYLAEAPRSLLFDPANPPPLESISAKVLDGKVARFFASGEPIGTLKPNTDLAVKVLTSLRIEPQEGLPSDSRWPEIVRRNVMDPAAFWHALWQVARSGILVFKTDTDFSVVSQWNDGNQDALKRIIVELRDEYNTPITSSATIANKIEIASQPLAFARAIGAAGDAGVADFYYAYLLAEGESTDLSLATIHIQPPPVVSYSEENVVFFNFHSGQSIIGETTSMIHLAAPQHLVIQAYRPSSWFAAQQATSALAFIDADPDPVTAPASAQLNRYTYGNEVNLLIDGVQYFRSLIADIEKVETATTTDFIHLSAWSIGIDFPLLSAPRYTTTPRTLQQLLENKLARVRALIYENPIQLGSLLYDTDPAVKFLNAEGSQLRAIHDNRQEGLDSAAHMKIVVVNAAAGSGLVAYCGGIDIGADRVTDSRHRESANVELPFPDGLHDTMLRVRGEAAHELNLILYKRWLDAILYEPTPEKAEFRYTPYRGVNDEGTVLCQVAMTIDHRPNPPYGFAELGDATLRGTLLNAIANARQYVYVEDQYFREPFVIQALNNAAGRGVKILVVLPREMWDPESTPKEAFEALIPGILENGDYFNETAKEIAQPLLTNVQSVGIYYLTVPPQDIYVHSKLMIVDDIFVSCGSANLDPRGLGWPLGVPAVNAYCTSYFMH